MLGHQDITWHGQCHRQDHPANNLSEHPIARSTTPSSIAHIVASINDMLHSVWPHLRTTLATGVERRVRSRPTTTMGYNHNSSDSEQRQQQPAQMNLTRMACLTIN